MDAEWAGSRPYHTNNDALAIAVNYPYWNFSDRVDYNITDKLRVYARTSLLRTASTTSNPPVASVPERPGSTRNARSTWGT